MFAKIDKSDEASPALPAVPFPTRKLEIPSSCPVASCIDASIPFSLATQTAFLTMAILVNPETRILVQGITGSFGARHA